MRTRVIFAGVVALTGALLSVPIAHAIEGGEPVADAAAYPWLASIAVDGKHTCGGALYAPDLVLTAGHCLEDLDGSQLEVTFGALDTTAADGPGRLRVRASDWYVVAPNYSQHRANGFISSFHDWGLLRLSRPVGLPTLPLGADPADATGRVTVMGWGGTPGALRAGEAATIADSECAGRSATIKFIAEGMLCLAAGGSGATGSPESCDIRTTHGDSGSPAVKRRPDGTQVQVGLVSLAGFQCDGGVLTEVAHYAPAIAAAAASLGRFPLADTRRVAGPGEFPWLASIRRPDGWCAGSLYAPDLVLTSGECTRGAANDALAVSFDGIPAIRSIKIVDGGAEAMIRLAEKVSLPALAVSKDRFDGGAVTVAGWDAARQQVRAADVTADVDWQKCRDRFGPTPFGDGNAGGDMCTETGATAADAAVHGCKRGISGGDPGAPVVRRLPDGSHLQVAVTSSVSGNCRKVRHYSISEGTAAWLAKQF